MEFILEMGQLEIRAYTLKLICMLFFIYYTSLKIINFKRKKIFKNIILNVIIVILGLLCSKIKYKYGTLYSLIIEIISLAIMFSYFTYSKLGYAMLITIISVGINYAVFSFVTFVAFVITTIFNLENMYICFIIIFLLYSMFLYLIFKIKRVKNGILFLQKGFRNEYIDILMLNISTMLLMYVIIISNYIQKFTTKAVLCLIYSSIIMFIIIQKSLQLYYKQKMLIKDLTETKDELENKKKEIAELEAENIRISKKNHTIVHKQKSIEHKLEEMLMKTEISAEESAEVKERLEKLHTQIYSEKENTDLDKTGISNIDDMLKYMQSECIKNKIEFTLVIKGNIHYMVNNLISKEDLETLLADHIKDAIIAINHTENINRSILVKLGSIDGIYSLYIYDSGIEFKKEVLENLGKKPFTTYKDEGGTGMGFMNTFDTLRKCKASLTIEEFNEPRSDNYTKVIRIKFNNKNDFCVKSYQGIEIEHVIK